MTNQEENIYRLEKYKWVDFLSFAGTRTRGTATGWHYEPYAISGLRTLGVRWLDASRDVGGNDIAYRGTVNGSVYADYNTFAGYVCQIKFDPSKLVAIWYRYARIDAILVPFTEMPMLKVLSMRGNSVSLGNCDLSNCPNFSHFEISSADGEYNSISSVTFHPDAPLKFAYLDSSFPQQVKDACLTQAYNHRNVSVQTNYGDRLIGISGYSASLQYMVDELVNNYGWAIS